MFTRNKVAAAPVVFDKEQLEKSQYISAIFYADDAQKKVARELIQILEDKGNKIATKLIKAKKFWPAEDYHQDYYEKKGAEPYCHTYKNYSKHILVLVFEEVENSTNPIQHSRKIQNSFT